jgi:hypothetical protein
VALSLRRLLTPFEDGRANEEAMERLESLAELEGLTRPALR